MILILSESLGVDIKWFHQKFKNLQQYHSWSPSVLCTIVLIYFIPQYIVSSRAQCYHNMTYLNIYSPNAIQSSLQTWVFILYHYLLPEELLLAFLGLLVHWWLIRSPFFYEKLSLFLSHLFWIILCWFCNSGLRGCLFSYLRDTA